MAEQAQTYHGWTVWVGEAREDNVLGSEAETCDVAASLAAYEGNLSRAIHAQYPGIEIIHENAPGMLGGNALVVNAEGDDQDDEGLSIDQIINSVFEGGEWAVSQ